VITLDTKDLVDKFARHFKKEMRHLLRSKTMKINVLAMILGLFSGLIVVAFYRVLDILSLLFNLIPTIMEAHFGTVGERIGIILMVTSGGFIVGAILSHFEKKHPEHGITRLIEAIAIKGGRVSFIAPILTFITAPITLASGGSAGPEGPFASIGGSIGSIFGQIFKLRDDDIALLIVCGTSASIAAAFNAPIGGFLFGIEFMLPEIAFSAIVPIVLASVIAVAISNYFIGYEVELTGASFVYNATEVPLYLVMGLIFGFISVFWVKFYYKFEDFFASLKYPLWVKTTIGGLATGIIAAFYPQVMGKGFNIARLTFLNQLTLDLLVVIVVLKMIATALTLGSGERGGLLAPSLAIGALLGGIFGLSMKMLFPGMVVNPGAFAFVGMGAFFAGASKAPLANSMLTIELTHDYLFIVPVLAATATSYLVSAALTPEGIYTRNLLKRGIIVLRGQRRDVLEQIFVVDIMNLDVVTIPQEMRLIQVIELMERTHIDGFPVVDSNNNLVGIICDDDIIHAVVENKISSKVSDVMKKNVIVAFPFETALEALTKIEKNGIGRLPVVDPKNPKKIIGILTRLDIINAYKVRSIVRRTIERELK